MARGLGQGIIDSIPRLSASGRAVSDADRGLMREARVADDVNRHDRGEFAGFGHGVYGRQIPACVLLRPAVSRSAPYFGNRNVTTNSAPQPLAAASGLTA